MSDFTTSALVRARFNQRCDECGDPIVKGQLHVVFSGSFDGRMFRARICRFCDWLREGLAAELGHNPDMMPALGDARAFIVDEYGHLFEQGADA